MSVIIIYSVFRPQSAKHSFTLFYGDAYSKGVEQE